MKNCTLLSAVRKDNQLRIRTGKTSVKVRVRAVANGGQESAGRKGNQPRIRTGKTGVEVRVRAVANGGQEARERSVRGVQSGFQMTRHIDVLFMVEFGYRCLIDGRVWLSMSY